MQHKVPPKKVSQKKPGIFKKRKRWSQLLRKITNQEKGDALVGMVTG